MRDLRDIGADIPVYNITKCPYQDLDKKSGQMSAIKEGVIYST